MRTTDTCWSPLSGTTKLASSLWIETHRKRPASTDSRASISTTHAIFTYSEAWQNLKDVLDLARAEGEVRIQRRNGETSSLTAVSEHEEDESPLDVGCVETSITRDQIVSAVREGRERV